MLSLTTVCLELFLTTCWCGLCVTALGIANENKNECLGSEEASPSHDNNPTSRYEWYRKMYTNCTHVKKSVEIKFLDSNDTYDLSFLKDIREVNGYVYILGNHIEVLPLTSLRVIRGKNLYRARVPDTGEISDFSLYIALNNKENSTVFGLKEVQLPSLYEILDGSAIFIDNFMLCYVQSIVWSDIFSDRSAKFWFDNAPSKFHVPCETSCHENCSMPNSTEPAHCWGPQANQCQQRHPQLCHAWCNGRCYGPGESECCDSECIGGCNGRLNTECWACRNLNDSGACVKECPPVLKYNPVKWQYEENPFGKFAFGLKCIKNCSSVNLLADGTACVASCRPDYKPENGRCVPCSGVCEKTCKGVEDDSWVNSENIKTFAGCTVIDGNIDIKDVSFSGDERDNLTELTVNDMEVFKTVRQVNGYFRVEANLSTLTNLSFFRSLSVVKGNTLFNPQLGFSIVMTNLEYLGLISLKQIDNGKVRIARNPKLCYPSRQVWLSLVPKERLSLIYHPNATGCSCSQQCLESDGCWGPKAEHCRRCRSYRYQDYCVSECSVNHLASVIPSEIYENVAVYVVNSNITDGGRLCQQCHEECNETCSGPGADNCKSCRHYKDGPYCVRECPLSKYPHENGTCQPCHPNCHERHGCSGPLSHLGINGCNFCADRVFDWFNQSQTPSDDTSSPWQPGHCMSSSSECPEGFFSFKSHFPLSFETSNGTKSSKLDMCHKCHEECVNCSDKSAHCTHCRHFRQQQVFESKLGRQESAICVQTCSPKHYLESNTSDVCLPCHEECDKCNGPTQYDCQLCKNFKFYLSESSLLNETDKNITSDAECIPKCLLKVVLDSNYERICTADLTRASLSHPTNPIFEYGGVYPIVGAISAVLILCLVVIIFGYIKYRSTKTEVLKTKLQAQISGFDDKSLELTDKSPDMASLRVINDSELNLVEVIGAGAFGTVYKGIWSPAAEKGRVSVEVAVKVLQTSESSGDLLEEARVMASVHHSCCIRIIAVSMAAQMKLVTQLMTQGCLLDYVRKNKQNIGSLTLLNWAAQTAAGMKHLEDLGIVHRDLAARNILLQSLGQIKITDFGLAKLLKNDDYVLSTGGKVPIKWLALESIQYRLFTHKTDVWSYGVTLWEMFTFGERPFVDVPALQMAQVLEKGERLVQPAICTIDVYMLMIKCWMVDAECRPSFTELQNEFSKMSKDPGRYLVIQGDRLMRLPSHIADSELLLHDTSFNLDNIATDVNIMSVEDYLRPEDVDNSAALQQETRFDDAYENVNNNMESQWGSRTKGYGSHSLNKPIFQRKMSQRYSADPCKDDVDVADCSKVKLVPRPPRLLHDETNYIEPRPSVVDRKGYLEVIHDDTVPQGYMDMTSPSIASLQQPFIADNPEYFSDVIKSSERFGDNPEYFSDVMQPERSEHRSLANKV